MSEQRERKVQALVAKFHAIAAERLERLNNSFLTLESNPDDPQAESTLLREIHTLKGEAKLMGFPKVNVAAHRTEDLIFKAKQQRYRCSEELSQSILAGLDLIAALMGPVDETGQGELDRVLDAFLARADGALTSVSPEPTLGSVPPWSAGSVPPAGSSVAPAPPEDEPTGAASPPGRSSTIRIDLDRLDYLADRVSDLARHHVRLERDLELSRQIGEAWRRESRSLDRGLRGDDAPAGEQEHVSEHLVRLRALNEQLVDVLSRSQEVAFAREYGIRELENAVKGLRLVPLSTLFGRYPRALRDLAREQGKHLRLTIEGGQLEVDNRVLEHLDEPLLHIFRNAVDHGVERPEERRRAGKPEEGQVRLVARQGGSHVEIAISDDGRGLVPEVILDAATRSGLITPEEAAGLPESEVERLVLRPGFTTRERVTDLSGRGMGLDVVRSQVESLGGSVGISGEPGKGTTVRLRLPISVALMPALVVRVGEVLVAFPSHTVSSILDVEERSLTRVGRRAAVRIGDEHLPIEELPALLGVRDAGGEERDEVEGIDRVLVVEDQGRMLGLRGGTVVEERELTLRPLGPFLRDLHLFFGAAILDHGEPALVVSVSELMRRAELGLRPSARAPATAGAPAQRSVLLVEDSEIVRDMFAGLLRGFGHAVIEAANGRDALTLLERSRPDVVVTDLEMPVMDGFELIERMRANPGVADLPIVVLTSRGSDVDKQRAGELGADAYLVKSEFNEDLLAETVARFLGPDGAARRR
jgi:two-component system chemotaxis sensor kinase CheA/two-component system sensor histidine kinase and response regulator WspE